MTMKDHYQDVINHLKAANPWILILLVALLVLEKALLAKGLALEVQVSHKNYRFKEGLMNAYVAGLFNNITPGASGGQVAQLYIFRKQGVSVSSAVGVLWLDFIAYQATMIAVVLVLLLLRFGYFYRTYSSFFAIVLGGFLVATGVIVFLILLAKSKRFYTWITTKGIYIGAKLHMVKDVDASLSRLDKTLENLAHEITILHQNHRLVYQLVSINVLRFLIIYSVPVLCAWALHIPFTLSNVLDMMALSSFVAMVNAFLPMPGSSGGTEATFVLMFSTIFTSAQATSIMILWRLSTFYLTLIIGAIVFLIVKMKNE
ncbi:flippase-like domain-containing protein [Trueperella sp. zg.1013]|nr:flippase-like domain-containing protein [Trueperella sp. zg.1013]